MRDGGSRLGYQGHYLVDGGKARIILAALATPAEVPEEQPLLDLLWHARSRWRLRPRQVTGDKSYGTIEIIGAVEEQGSAPMSAPGLRPRARLASASRLRLRP